MIDFRKKSIPVNHYKVFSNPKVSSIHKSSTLDMLRPREEKLCLNLISSKCSGWFCVIQSLLFICFLVCLFTYLFCLLITPGNAQGLILPLHLGISPGDTLGTTWDEGISQGKCHICYANHSLPIYTSLSSLYNLHILYRQLYIFSL